VVATAFAERAGTFSPDGLWLAYVSDRSGQDEVYVRPFPGPGEEVTISAGGGDEPVWAASGRELYYRTGNDLVAVTVESGRDGLSSGRPTILFRDPYLRDSGGALAIPNYDVSPSGDGFLMLESAQAESSPEAGPRLHIVLNFVDELRARVPN
jgi:Tol biopolymer transport system component